MDRYPVDFHKVDIVEFAKLLVPVIQVLCLGEPAGSFNEAAARSSDEYVLGRSGGPMLVVRQGEATGYQSKQFFSIDLLTAKRLTLRLSITVEDFQYSQSELIVDFDGEEDEVERLRSAIAPLLQELTK